MLIENLNDYVMLTEPTVIPFTLNSSDLTITGRVSYSRLKEYKSTFFVSVGFNFTNATSYRIFGWFDSDDGFE